MVTNARGERNNNPMNIDRTNIAWLGMAADQSSDPRFIVFTDAKYGIRAGAKIILNGALKNRITVKEIIDAWAPPVENNTSAYVSAVAADMDVEPDHELNLHDYDTLSALLKAIIKHENGSQPYSDVTFRAALELVGVKPPMAPLSQTPAIQANCVVGSAGAIAVATQIVPMIQPAMPLVQTVAAAAPWALGVIVILVAAYLIYVRVTERKQGIH